MEKIICGLCASRHPLPVTEYIYPETVNPLDFDGLRATAVKFVLDRVGVESVYAQPINGNDYTDTACFCGRRELVVYVTGLTAATAAVIAACAENGVHLTLMHYDRDSGDYKPQVIF